MHVVAVATAAHVVIAGGHLQGGRGLGYDQREHSHLGMWEGWTMAAHVAFAGGHVQGGRGLRCDQPHHSHLCM